MSNRLENLIDAALIQEGPGDYVLRPEKGCVWITVKNLSLMITQCDKFVRIRSFERHKENEDMMEIGDFYYPDP